MPFSDIVNVEIDEILNKLTTEGAVNLIAGVGPLHAASIERLSVPAIKVRLLLRRHIHASRGDCPLYILWPSHSALSHPRLTSGEILKDILGGRGKPFRGATLRQICGIIMERELG